LTGISGLLVVVGTAGGASSAAVASKGMTNKLDSAKKITVKHATFLNHPLPLIFMVFFSISFTEFLAGSPSGRSAARFS
jgi:Cu/Ag efflux protein CusF